MLKERINKLLKVVNEEDLWLLKNSLESIFDFMQLDAKIEAELRALRTRNFDAETYAEEREYLLVKRHYKKRATVISIRILNRLSNLYNVEKIYEGRDDEESLLEFAKELIKEYFGVHFENSKTNNLSA